MFFQLETALVLMGSTCVSLGALYLTRTREGKLQLPVNDEDTPHGHDPFDVTNAEDIIEGYPIEPEVFWEKARYRKLIVSILLTAVIAIDATSLGRSVTNGLTDEIVAFSLNVSFATYILILTIRSTNNNDASQHSEYVLHLSTMSTLVTVLLGTIVILPTTPSISTLQETDPFPRVIWYKLFLYVFVSLVAYTTPQGPRLRFPPERIFSEKTILTTTNTEEENVCGVYGASPWNFLFFLYTSKVVQLGKITTTLEVGNLPIIPANMRAKYNYPKMKRGMREIHLRIASWRPRPGSGWALAYRLFWLNFRDIVIMICLTVVSSIIFYAPAVFLRKFLGYLETNESREHIEWGLFYVAGLFTANVTVTFVTEQLWSWVNNVIQIQAKLQLNTMLFAKTLVRKDVASSAPPPSSSETRDDNTMLNREDDEFSSKVQVMNLMTSDVDRVGRFARHTFLLISAPVEIAIGLVLLYALLGVSCFFGFAAACILLPLNQVAGKVIVRAQESLMKARDERVALTNEILGAIRMLKFMAWERKFEAKVMKVREKELKSQRLNYTIETLWNTIWSALPILVTLISFWHFTNVRHQTLSPSIAFTSLIVFSEMKFPLITLPEAFIGALQAFVSLRRIEKYMNGTEVSPVPPMNRQSQTITFQSCTVTWPRTHQANMSSAASTPSNKFMLLDLSVRFPRGELSLVCGKLGSGKSLLLLSLLGEADILAGSVHCPRSPPDSIASFADIPVLTESWIVQGICAYVPQTAWLRNESIKENILFNLPYNPERYHKTLEVCALVSDLEILEDGDESEIGERGVNLSGGQKARVSLARAVYSRASILLLDDVLSAVDAHTAHYLYHQCLKGELMTGRTIILVSHHIQLCVPGANYIVALDNGRLQFEGGRDNFMNSTVMQTLIHSTDLEGSKEEVLEAIEEKTLTEESNYVLELNSTASSTSHLKNERKPARKLVEEEARAIGVINRRVWRTYIQACGNSWYWALFLSVLLIVAISPVLENGWLRYWASAASEGRAENPAFYMAVYAAITGAGVVIGAIRFLILYNGSIRASTVLYKRMLETILFAGIRFHDTVSRGRLLNRFGKDFEGVDSSLADNFGRSMGHALGVAVSITTIIFVGGYRFVIAACILGAAYYKTASMYRRIARDMRRLDSVTRSPLYSIYGDTISGVTVLRAFGASSKFLRDMLCCADTNNSPSYWTWGVNRWVSIRFGLLSGCVSGATALAALFSPSINASMAGFALTFAYTMSFDLSYLVYRFVGLEQSMVALERIKEYTELDREPVEFSKFRPPVTWPSSGSIVCQDLVIRYAPGLPDVLHRLNFEVMPGEKIGILGRTGSGKSTLALSFFRFVEAMEGRILVDGINIADVGLTDLRSRLTIIPQDPSILSGNLRSTIDISEEHEDADIFEALRRVHLIPSEEVSGEVAGTTNTNTFRDLDSPVSEGGENFSTGEKQLLCMARAILKRSKVLVMDEATASIDYATDELIGKTIRQEFAESTILTIAHRLRTVIDYDRVMLLDNGHIVEYDRPSILLQDSSSKFYALCKATGREEFAVLKKIAGV